MEIFLMTTKSPPVAAGELPAASSMTERMANILKIQLSEVERDPSDSYMRGLYNGMLMVCCCEDETDYKPYPKAASAPQATILPPGLERLHKAARKFAEIVNTSSGRIPTERLSFADWHELVAAYKECDAPAPAASSADRTAASPYEQMLAGNHTIGAFKDGKLIAADADVYIDPAAISTAGLPEEPYTLATLRKWRDEKMNVHADNSIVEHVDALRAAFTTNEAKYKAEIERFTIDSKRYRHIRENPREPRPMDDQYLYGEFLDAAIDAAIVDGEARKPIVCCQDWNNCTRECKARETRKDYYK
jgi:hypothetical protein